jgi:superfamily II DNA or RNA helicase
VDRGVYVRCPIKLEEADQLFPRCFIMGQVVSYDELSDTVDVRIFDLFGCRQYYEYAFKEFTFDAKKVRRCSAPIGSMVKVANEIGIVEAVMKKQDDDGKFSYYVRLQNGNLVQVCEDKLQIDFTQMNYSPLQQMLEYEFHNPSWYANRLKVSKNMHMVNNAVYGFKTLAGCRTFLLPHQIITIVRCFESSSIRFMLADEVGLGKTIEACSIIKIMNVENRKLRALYIVPSSLIMQWKNELFYKFNISADIDTNYEKAEHLIVPLESISTGYIVLSQNWNIAIVDETHRLLNDPSKYSNILMLSKTVKNILLLSATPIQDRKEEYLKLLALLNPEQYENMPMDAFLRLSEKQQGIQRKVNLLLKRMENYEDYSQTIIKQLSVIANDLNDQTLIRLVDSINLASEDEGREITEQALAYICENYRLERCVIRNRRDLLKNKLPSREVEAISYVPLSSDEFYNENGTIEAVLSWLYEHNDGSVDFITDKAQPILHSLFSSPWALQSIIDNLHIKDFRIETALNSWKESALHEENNLNRALDEDPDLIKGRLLKAIDYIEQETDLLDDPSAKIVVFTSFTETLHHFIKLAHNRWGDGFSVAFCKGMSRTELEDSVYEFQNNNNCRILVCDEMGGEGRNFQNADMIIHLDLPWSANTLEQRIGRLDRLGREINRPVKSVVFYSENTIEQQLFHVWKDGMKLFTESLSGLEIVTGELNDLIVKALSENLYNGLENSLPQILETMNIMRETVRDEQLFDIAGMLYRPLSTTVERMLSFYQGQEDEIFAEAMLKWSAQSGLNSEAPTPSGLIEFRQERFSVNSAIKSLLIPPDWSNYLRYPMVKRFGRILGTFNRQTAIEREDVLFFAPSDPIFDTIINNAMNCNRGRCCAFETTGDFNYIGFAFVFNIEPDVKPLIENEINFQALSQFRMFLNMEQIYVFVPIMQTNSDVSENELKKILSEHWRIRNASHLGARSGFEDGQSPLQNFQRSYPPEIWNNIVKNAYKKARDKAVNEVKNTSDFKTAKREIIRIINGYLAESLFFNRGEEKVNELKRTYKAVYDGITHPQLSLDSVSFMKVRKVL